MGIYPAKSKFDLFTFDITFVKGIRQLRNPVKTLQNQLILHFILNTIYYLLPVTCYLMFVKESMEVFSNCINLST